MILTVLSVSLSVCLVACPSVSVFVCLSVCNSFFFLPLSLSLSSPILSLIIQNFLIFLTTLFDCRCLIFVLYKKEAVTLQNTLTARGFNVTAIHGDKSQHDRTAALEEFKSGKYVIMLTLTLVTCKDSPTNIPSLTSLFISFIYILIDLFVYLFYLFIHLLIYFSPYSFIYCLIH